MNNIPLFRNRWGMAEPGYHKASSKVVSIPVHFVGSERSRTDSATKIQRVLRGFLVRNALRKISSMRVELERIESEIVGVEAMKLKREQRERVRVSETIMNLLFKLDSVRVLHYSGLRECRKSLINKAIVLQEMLDHMALSHSHEGLKMEEKEAECVEEDNCLVKEEEDNEMESSKNGEIERKEEEESGFMEEENIGLGTSSVEEKECEIRCEEQENIEALRNENVKDKESVGTSLVEENCLVKEEEDGRKGELLLEKMVEDNQKMMEMMAQLFQSNEMQTTLLTSLTQRVEQLERALACEKLRRKKNRKAGAKNKQNHSKNGFI